MWSRIHRCLGYIRVGIPSLPKCPVLKNYRTFQTMGYRYRKNTEFTKVVGHWYRKRKCTELIQVPCADIEVVPNKYRYSRHRGRGYRYPGYIWVGVPKLPKCRVPVSSSNTPVYVSVGYSPSNSTAVYCNRRYVPYRIYPRGKFSAGVGAPTISYQFTLDLAILQAISAL